MNTTVGGAVGDGSDHRSPIQSIVGRLLVTSVRRGVERLDRPEARIESERRSHVAVVAVRRWRSLPEPYRPPPGKARFAHHSPSTTPLDDPSVGRDARMSCAEMTHGLRAVRYESRADLVTGPFGSWLISAASLRLVAMRQRMVNWTGGFSDLGQLLFRAACSARILQTSAPGR